MRHWSTPSSTSCRRSLKRAGNEAAAVMWRRKNSELKGQAQGRKEANRKQSPEPVLDARF
jgi:hypothetical protein